MFENETKNILNKYNESKKILQKLHDLVEPYGYNAPKHDSVFYTVIPSLHSMNSLEYDVNRALSDILTYRNIRRLPGHILTHYYGDTKITIKDHIKRINGITPSDFYYNAFYHQGYNSVRGYDVTYTFSHNTYEDRKAGETGMYLILNCIYLLNNPEPITREQTQAIFKTLQNSNTFVFCGCKVSAYKNGRLLVKFSDNELFIKFKKQADAAMQTVIKEIKQEDAKAAEEDGEEIPF